MCRKGHVDVVKDLLVAGADPMATDNVGRTAAHDAAAGASVAILAEFAKYVFSFACFCVWANVRNLVSRL